VGKRTGAGTKEDSVQEYSNLLLFAEKLGFFLPSDLSLEGHFAFLQWKTRSWMASFQLRVPKVNAMQFWPDEFLIWAENTALGNDLGGSSRLQT
jgi:hypothetical protein